MKKTLLLILISALYSTFMFGQIAVSEKTRNDTVSPEKLKSINIDNQKVDIIDTLHNPLFFILQNTDNKSYSISLPKRKKTISFGLIDSGKIDSIFRMQLNKNKSDELIIYYSQDSNWSHANIGLASTKQFIAIYDLDKLEIIFNKKIIEYENTWGKDDEGNQYNKEQIIKYDIELNQNQIKLKLNNKSSTANKDIEQLTIYTIL